MLKKGYIIILIIAVLIVILISSSVILGVIVYKKAKDIKNTNVNQAIVNDSLIKESSLQKFTVSEFDDYVKKIEDQQKVQKDSESDFGLFDSISPSTATESTGLGEASSDSAAAAEKTSITNTQEQGVDEGDIVKVYKDYFIVLSRGRLFSVKIKNGEKEILEATYKGEAYAPGFTNGTWYDELLIDNDNIVVIGYTYSLSATQVGLFKINDQGQITHQNTYFIDSNDYYSSRNYASRLADGKLIFYMPYYLMSGYYEGSEYRYGCRLPRLKKWVKDNEVTEGQEILTKDNIYKPLQSASSYTLHMVVTCDLQSAPFVCTAKAVLGPYARSYYVSENNVYIWASGYDYTYTNSGAAQAISYLYSLSLKNDTVGAVRAYGAPLDQFSFKETADGYLNVFLLNDGYGEAMGNAEYNNSDALYLRFPLSSFSANPYNLSSSYYHTLPEPTGSTLQNRFVGDYLLYGAGSSWWEDDTAGKEVYIVNYAKQGPVQKLKMNNGVDRIEVLSLDQAVIIGGNADDLLFNWIELGEEQSKLLDTYTLNEASQGETRSHGFFYNASQNTLGLPIRGTGSEGYEQLYSDSAAVAFLSLNQDSKKFIDLGKLEDKSEDTSTTFDGCLYSCTDWYGNSRPLFYQGRIFALMGYKLIEGKIENNVISSSRQLNFYTGR